MMPRYVAVWSLQRGLLDEYVPPAVQFELEREAVLASIERDPPLTQEQRWFEEGGRMGYRKVRRAARVAA